MVSEELILSKIKDYAEVYNEGTQLAFMQYADTRLFKIRNTSVVDEKMSTRESGTGFKEVTEGETGDEFKIREGYESLVSTRDYAMYLEITEKMRLIWDADPTVRVNEFLQEQTFQAMQDAESVFLDSIFRLYNEAFTSTELFAPDTANIIGTHTWKSGTTFTNKFTKKMSQDLLDDVNAYGANFVDADGHKMPMSFDIVVVKTAGKAFRAAKKLLTAQGVVPNRVGEINIYEGSKTIIETPFIDSEDAVFFISSSKANTPEFPLYVGINDLPKFRTPVTYKNNSISTRISGYWKYGCTNLPYAICASDGSTGAYPSQYVEVVTISA